MKDFLGKELNIGDSVVYMKLGYRDLAKGKIIKMTNKTILLKTSGSFRNEVKQFPEQVIKYEEK